jgi:hypothetical protein
MHDARRGEPARFERASCATTPHRPALAAFEMASARASSSDAGARRRAAARLLGAFLSGRGCRLHNLSIRIDPMSRVAGKAASVTQDAKALVLAERADLAFDPGDDLVRLLGRFGLARLRPEINRLTGVVERHDGTFHGLDGASHDPSRAICRFNERLRQHEVSIGSLCVDLLARRSAVATTEEDRMSTNIEVERHSAS